MGHWVPPQFVTIEQLGEAVKQVQDAVIKGICEQMKIADPPRVEEVGVGQGSRVRLSPQRTPIDIAPSRSVATPYASREHGEAWYMEQEESSHPSRSGRERAVKRNPTQDGFTRRILEEERRTLQRDPRSEREEHGRNPRRGNPSRHLGEPSLLDVGLVRPATQKVGNSLERGSCPTYVTPFSREILEAPRLGKVKMPSVTCLMELLTRMII